MGGWEDGRAVLGKILGEVKKLRSWGVCLSPYGNESRNVTCQIRHAGSDPQSICIFPLLGGDLGRLSRIERRSPKQLVYPQGFVLTFWKLDNDIQNCSLVHGSEEGNLIWVYVVL